MKGCWMRALWLTLLVLGLPTSLLAQRELHWDALQVTAHLDSRGILQVAETHTMVFTGDWNGGERSFNIRPRQRLIFTGIYREKGGGWQPLTENSSLNRVDDYAWTDSKTLRWRSRLPTDRPFARTPLRYQLRYNLTGILLNDGHRYLLDHDFALPDRAGSIGRFELRLTLDPAWQPAEPIRDVYTASNLRPGASFVLKLPLRFSGAGTPVVRDLSRPRDIQLGVFATFGATLLMCGLFCVREQSVGRVDSLTDEVQVTESWLDEHILTRPAEIVGAAWDDRVGRPEVVALLARLTHDRKLESEASRDRRRASMTLR